MAPSRSLTVTARWANVAPTAALTGRPRTRWNGGPLAVARVGTPTTFAVHVTDPGTDDSRRPVDLRRRGAHPHALAAPPALARPADQPVSRSHGRRLARSVTPTRGPAPGPRRAASPTTTVAHRRSARRTVVVLGTSTTRRARALVVGGVPRPDPYGHPGGSHVPAQHCPHAEHRVRRRSAHSRPRRMPSPSSARQRRRRRGRPSTRTCSPCGSTSPPGRSHPFDAVRHRPGRHPGDHRRRVPACRRRPPATRRPRRRARSLPLTSVLTRISTTG